MGFDFCRCNGMWWFYRLLEAELRFDCCQRVSRQGVKLYYVLDGFISVGSTRLDNLDRIRHRPISLHVFT